MTTPGPSPRRWPPPSSPSGWWSPGPTSCVAQVNKLLDLAESGIDGKVFSARLEERGVLAHLVPGHVRLTFHLGISREDAMEAARAVIETAEGGAHGTGGV